MASSYPFYLSNPTFLQEDLTFEQIEKQKQISGTCYYFALVFALSVSPTGRRLLNLLIHLADVKRNKNKELASTSFMTGAYTVDNHNLDMLRFQNGKNGYIHRAVDGLRALDTSLRFARAMERPGSVAAFSQIWRSQSGLLQESVTDGGSTLLVIDSINTAITQLFTDKVSLQYISLDKWFQNRAHELTKGGITNISGSKEDYMRSLVLAYIIVVDCKDGNYHAMPIIPCNGRWYIMNLHSSIVTGRDHNYKGTFEVSIPPIPVTTVAYDKYLTKLYSGVRTDALNQIPKTQHASLQWLHWEPYLQSTSGWKMSGVLCVRPQANDDLFQRPKPFSKNTMARRVIATTSSEILDKDAKLTTRTDRNAIVISDISFFLFLQAFESGSILRANAHDKPTNVGTGIADTFVFDFEILGNMDKSPTAQSYRQRYGAKSTIKHLYVQGGSKGLKYLTIRYGTDEFTRDMFHQTMAGILSTLIDVMGELAGCAAQPTISVTATLYMFGVKKTVDSLGINFDNNTNRPDS